MASKRGDRTLDIVNTSNAATPLTDPSLTPLTVDVGAAYYVDYRNAAHVILKALAIS